MNYLTSISERRVYVRKDCVVFRKTNEVFGELSNMAPGFPLVVNDVHIRSSEALYQACRFPEHTAVQQEIIEQRSPMTAKMKSKSHIELTRSDWYEVRVKVMRWCLRMKLAQNWDSFAEVLLSTESMPIVEESPKDKLWGASPLRDGTLVGENVLGKLLEALREGLKSDRREELRYVKPINISKFSLYGEPIEAFPHLFIANSQPCEHSKQVLRGA